MTVRDTSLDSFTKLQPQIGYKQREVFDAFQSEGSSTDSEIMKVLGYTDPNKVRPRRKELVDKGLVIEDGKRECNVTGRTVMGWKVK